MGWYWLQVRSLAQHDDHQLLRLAVPLLQVQYNAAVACTNDLVDAVDDCGFDCKLLSMHHVDEGTAEQHDRPQVRPQTYACPPS